MQRWIKALKCGTIYKIGTSPPRNARYALYYWGYVIFHATKEAAEKSLVALSYYEQEDAIIEAISIFKKEKKWNKKS